MMARLVRFILNRGERVTHPALDVREILGAQWVLIRSVSQRARAWRPIVLTITEAEKPPVRRRGIKL